jgi:hypothetical protein
MSDITEAVETCIILHNMMVEERRDCNEEEQHHWYHFNNNDDEYNNNAPIDPAEEFVERQQVETELQNLSILLLLLGTLSTNWSTFLLLTLSIGDLAMSHVLWLLLKVFLAEMHVVKVTKIG